MHFAIAKFNALKFDQLIYKMILQFRAQILKSH